MKLMKAKRYLSRPAAGTLTLLVLLLSGCETENGGVTSDSQSSIRYDLTDTAGQTAGTKSAAAAASEQHECLLTDAGRTLPLRLQMESSSPSPTGQTRGTMVSALSGLQAMTPSVDCYDGSTKYFSGVTLSYSGGKWTPSADYLWKSGHTLSFHAVAGLPSAVGNSFTTACDRSTLACVIPASASEQKDILVGYWKSGLVTSGDSKAKATIRFSHPLAAVRFKLGTVEGFTETDVVKSISVGGLYVSGTCVATYADDGTPTFTWTPSDGTQTVTMGSASGLTVTDGIIGAPFILVPQTFSDGAKATVSMTLTVGGDEYTVSGELASGAFQQGKVTTLTIGAVTKKEVSIEFSDEVVYESGWPKKQSLVIENTGNANAFIRISLVGNWVNKNSKVVCAWSETDACGSFDGAANGLGLSGSEYWTKGADGFWYYKYYIKPGQTLKNPLFGYYKINTLPSVESIRQLDLNVNVQAVMADDRLTDHLTTAKGAWTETIVSAVGLTYEEDK